MSFLATSSKKYLFAVISLSLGMPKSVISWLPTAAKKVQVYFCKAWIFRLYTIYSVNLAIASWSWMLTKFGKIWSKGSSEYVEYMILVQYLPKKSFWFSKSCCQKTCFQQADFLLFWEYQKCCKNASTACWYDGPKVRNMHFRMPEEVV